MIKNIFSSQSGINAERQDSFNTRLLRQELAGTAPIFALSAGSKSFALTSKVHYWFEKKAYSNAFAFTANALATATSVTVDKGSIIEESSIIVHPTTGEYMFVSGVSGNTLTVIRGFADSTASAITANDEGLYLGTAKKEGSLAPANKYRRGVPRFNYSQIFRNGYGNSRTAEHIKFITGNKAAENKADAIAMHAQDIEMAILMGRKTMSQVNGDEVLSTCDGLMNMVEKNTALTANVTLDDIIDWASSLFDTNVQGMPNERIGITSRNVINIINKLIRKEASTQITMSPSVKCYGLDVVSLQLPGVPEFKLLSHPLFAQSSTLNASLLAYHPGLFSTGYITDAEVTDATVPGMDGKAEVITSELTVEYDLGETGGVLSNIKLA